ncbi:acyl CoA:acetate/3-ketoacid CoA transferase [Verminephrobacter aporrectodeae]|uniref:acyl CoA:acetate/3-ketoacid CoA transferase n=1 Tax=Verminephrobacter aporrectodeae TaxID=1110389 RepID=UPI002244D7E4|nr:acyl CoA:acetate/3-ketoacid CoA transferase [Verminephrobacter aporrectodeae]MCW8174537.1 acyl CoA:acetate/3-ketoacid CoA transferase [Verminephrobacter aporrectodeae subsp. tuberculatae]MCW8202171.1 acyl CoA:acetate/3-ketoacid CoA transferase [Verminephrobacter aporrectodeae subsp. tuberculatae]
MSKLIEPEQAAALVRDGDIVSISSSSGLGCPDKVLEAIGARFEREGAPRNLTALSPIAAGDMYGIRGIDHLARPGLLRRILAGSYPSGPSSLPMPAIWRMIEGDTVAAYNIPSGILFDMHRDAAARRPGVLTQVGMGTFADPAQQGCAMNASAAAQPVVRKERFDGRDWLYFPAVVPQVAIIRATTADERGNLTYEHEGALLGGLEQALAARNNGGIVIAQVKRQVLDGTLRPHDVRVPCNLVDYIVLDPGQMQTTQTLYDPAISGEIFQPLAHFAPQPWGAEKVIARRAALELRAGHAANLGFGISANVPRILLEEGLHGAVTWVIEQGAVGGMPLLGFAFGCSANADAIMPSPQQFSYFQGGGFDIALLSFLQVDGNGSVNVSKLGAKPYLTAGCGGFVDITAHARRIVFSGFFTAGARLEVGGGKLRIVQEGRTRKFVRSAEHITFSGLLGRERGQQVCYVTERCVVVLRDGALVVTEIAPGVDLQRDVLDQAEVPLQVADDLRPMDAALFMEQPMGLVLQTAGVRRGG